jgi:DNA-binding HxlR family transcriptional regulator
LLEPASRPDNGEPAPRLAFRKSIAHHAEVSRRRKSTCPVHHALVAFGDAWSLLIVRELMFHDARTWSDLAAMEEGIATNVLAQRLRRLRDEKLVRVERSPQGRAYRLTHRGIALLPMMLELVAWSAKYNPASEADRGLLRRFRNERAQELYRQRARLLGVRTPVLPGR